MCKDTYFYRYGKPYATKNSSAISRQRKKPKHKNERKIREGKQRGPYMQLVTPSVVAIAVMTLTMI